MSIAQLRAISGSDLPLLVNDLHELLGVRSLIEGGLVVGHGGTLRMLRCGEVVVASPALIKDVTARGRRFLAQPDPLLEALEDFFF